MIDLSWTGGMPETWKAIPLKSRFDFGKGLSITKADLVEEGVPVLSYGQIHSKNNPKASIPDALVRYIPKAIADSAPDSLAIRNGFIFADTSEDLDGCGNCNYVDRDDVYGGYHTVVLKPKKSVETDNKYLSYLFQTDAWRYQLRKELTEVKLYSVSQKALKSTWIIVPPHDEKEAIVRYLDSKCSAIDEAIERHKMIIEKLEELKKNTIAYAVRHGIHNNVPERESGLPWVKQIPAHWVTKPNKFVFSKVKDIVDNPSGHQVLSLTLNGVIVRNDEEFKGKKALSYDGYQVCYPNNLLMCLFDIDVTPRCVGLIHNDGITTPAYTQFKVNDNDDPEYYYYYYLSLDHTKTLLSLSRNIRNSMTADDFGRIYTIEPPKEEQREIASFLRNRCTEIDKLSTRQAQIIEKLEEYRKSIIYNAVTGKIDCREATK